MSTPCTAPPRLETVDVLRGLAALAVAVYHYADNLPPDGWPRWLTLRGWMGVEVFFVISGFIIPYTLWQRGYVVRRDWGKFVVKRIVRLDPPYFAVIALAVALAWLGAAVPGYRGETPHFDAVRLLLHVGYLNDFTRHPWMLPVFWSLAIEFQYYLLLAVLFPLIAHRRPAVRTLSVLSVSCLGLYQGGQSLIVSWFPLFALGMASFHYHAGMLRRDHFLLFTLVLGSVAGVAIGWETALLAVGTALGIAWVRVPRLRVLAFLGAISYSHYLLHIPVGNRVTRLAMRLGTSLGWQMAALAAATGASLAAAWVLYRLVERPAQRCSARITYGDS